MAIDKKKVRAEMDHLMAKLDELSPAAQKTAQGVIVALVGLLDAAPKHDPAHKKVLSDYLDKLEEALTRSQ